jgi:hypothetical protein
VVGGKGPGGVTLTSVEVYDFESEQWNTLSSETAVPRHSHAVRGALYFCGRDLCSKGCNVYISHAYLFKISIRVIQ